MVSRAQVFETLQERVLDPELGINIVDLGLVYRVNVAEDAIEVQYTLTYPGCPLEEVIRSDIQAALSDLSGLSREAIRAVVVWEPRWGPEFMSEEARVSLGYPI